MTLFGLIIEVTADQTGSGPGGGAQRRIAGECAQHGAPGGADGATAQGPLRRGRSAAGHHQRQSQNHNSHQRCRDYSAITSTRRLAAGSPPATEPAPLMIMRLRGTPLVSINAATASARRLDNNRFDRALPVSSA